MTRHCVAQPPVRPMLLDRVRLALRSRRDSRLTGQSRRLIQFHGLRHPAGMADPEISAFLTDLPVRGQVTASRHAQALSGLLPLYRYVLKRQIGDPGNLIRDRKPRRRPARAGPDRPRTPPTAPGRCRRPTLMAATTKVRRSELLPDRRSPSHGQQARGDPASRPRSRHPAAGEAATTVRSQRRATRRAPLRAGRTVASGPAGPLHYP